jgi:hypothetical protein
MALSCACRGLSLGKCVSPFQGRSPRNPAVAQGVAPQGVAPGRCPPQGVAPGRCPPRALPQAVAPPRALRQGVAPPGRCARALPPQGVASPGRCPGLICFAPMGQSCESLVQAGLLGRFRILPRRGRTNQPRATPWGRWGAGALGAPAHTTASSSIREAARGRHRSGWRQTRGRY